MPRLTPEQRSIIRQYASDQRMWFQSWLLEPVRKATQSMIPPGLNALYQKMHELENKLGEHLDQAIDIDEDYTPLLKRAVLHQQRRLAEKHEDIRSRTTGVEIRLVLEAELRPVMEFMSADWFITTAPTVMPRLTDFLTLQDAYQVLPESTNPPGSAYDEKFRILQGSAAFLPALKSCRVDGWLRNTNVVVAFVDIDDFKSLNTKYTESAVDREFLPRIMSAIEAHVYSHGWAYRFGGDEYILLLPNLDSAYERHFLCALQRRLGSLEFHHGPERITTSIGVCVIPPDSFLTDREAQEIANTAKQHAKLAGKNCIATSSREAGGAEGPHIVRCDDSGR